MGRGSFLAALLLGALLFAAPAGASDWLPHGADATWTYAWTDSVYNTTPTTEKVTVKDSKGTRSPSRGRPTTRERERRARQRRHRLLPGEPAAGSSTRTGRATRRPPASRSSARRSPAAATASRALLQPDLGDAGADARRAAAAGDDLDEHGRRAAVTSRAPRDYDGQEHGERARRSRCPSPPRRCGREITQAGALGDPYGSGVRTVWWVRGVGPVKVEFDHSGGNGAPVTSRSCSRRT